jgi:hypothetical protein
MKTGQRLVASAKENDLGINSFLLSLSSDELDSLINELESASSVHQDFFLDLQRILLLYSVI